MPKSIKLNQDHSWTPQTRMDWCPSHRGALKTPNFMFRGKRVCCYNQSQCTNCHNWVPEFKYETIKKDIFDGCCEYTEIELHGPLCLECKDQGDTHISCFYCGNPTLLQDCYQTTNGWRFCSETHHHEFCANQYKCISPHQLLLARKPTKAEPTPSKWPAQLAETVTVLIVSVFLAIFMFGGCRATGSA